MCHSVTAHQLLGLTLLSLEKRFHMKPKLRMRNIGALLAVGATLALAGCARNSVPDTAYNAGTGSGWDTSAAAVPANPPGAAPATQAMYTDQQTEAGGDAPAVSGCAQPVGYGYVTPAYASRYGVRMVRARVMVEQPRIYEERRVVRHGRSTGRSVAIVAGSAAAGAAIGGIAGGGKGAAIGAIAGGGGGFAYDRLTHNR